MPLIENSVGELPYKMMDFDQHSYEAPDCLHPVHAEGQAGHGGAADQVSGYEPQGAAGQRPDRHRARERPRPGLRPRLAGRDAQAAGVGRRHRRRPVLRADPAGVPRPRQARLVAAGRAADREVDHVSRRLGPARRGVPRRDRPALRQHRVVQPVDRRGLGLRLPRTGSTRRRCCRCATWTARARSWTGCSTRAPASSCCRPARRTAARRATPTSTRSGPASTRPRPSSATTSPSSTTRPTSPRTGAGDSCRRSSSRPGSGRTPTASGRSPTRCRP